MEDSNFEFLEEIDFDSIESKNLELEQASTEEAKTLQDDTECVSCKL